MVNHVPRKQSDIELITHRSWKRHTECLERPHRAAGPGAHVFIRVLRWSTLGLPR